MRIVKISAFFRFSSFWAFFLLHEKISAFLSACFMSIFAQTRLSHTAGEKFSEKKNCKGYSPILQYRFHRSCTKFLNNIFFNMYRNSLLSADTNSKNTHEKAHAFLWRSKNVKKKTDEKQARSKYTLMQRCESRYLPTANTQTMSVKQNCSELLLKCLNAILCKIYIRTQIHIID